MPWTRLLSTVSPLLLATGVVCFATNSSNAGSLTGPIYDQGLTAVLEDVRVLPTTAVPARPPLARINILREAPDGSGRMFVNDMNGPLYVIQGGTLQTYMDLRTWVPKLKVKPGLGSGFVSFAFHPDFATNGLFYTVQTESVGTKPPNLVPAVAVPIMHHCVLTEWHATNPAANTFSGTSRELMRVAALHYYHNMGSIEFNPNAVSGDPDYGLLYIGQGDYGSTDSGFPQELQRLDTVYGCTLRINPLGTPFVRNSITYPYGIPASNPFATTPGALGEIYTYGHRNAHRLQWDLGHHKTLFAADIGAANVEEVDLLVPGRNYGWPYREGTFALDPATWQTVFALPANDSTFHYTYPVAQFDHDPVLFPVHGTDTQCGIAGGVAYRGPIAGLQGKFVFGDIVTGRLFYAYIDQLEAADDGSPATTARVYALGIQYQGQIRSLLNIVSQAVHDTTTYRTDLRLATDTAGTLYLTTKQDATIRRITSVFIRPPLAVDDVGSGVEASVFPNPVRTASTLRFGTPVAGAARVELIDTSGRRRRTVMDQRDLPAGWHEVPLVSRTDHLRPGVYFVRIATAAGTSQRRIVVLEE